MKNFEIKIKIDFGEIYSCECLESATEIAEQKCEELYMRLDQQCSVYIESIMPVCDDK